MLMKRVFNKKGVALMLVLSAIVVLSTVLVEFAYNTNVNYNLAMNERDRLQSYYLAKSAYSFMLLELKFDRMFRQIVQSQNLSQYLGGAANMPLCQQFPLSTGLIRAVFTGGGLEGLMGGAGGEEDEGEGGEESQIEDKIERLQRSASVSAEKMASEFLEFEGDFDGECIDEGTKINLNGFVGLSKTSAGDGKPSPFDEYKQYLYKFLSDKKYEALFEDSGVQISQIVDNIGDWIDTDGEINEISGRIGGAERSIYDRLGVPYQPRNSKLITLLEAYLIDGVTDLWFPELQENFTIYGDGKINPCTAPREIVESLIVRYIASTPDLPPVRTGDVDEMNRLYDSINTACADSGIGDQAVSKIADALDKAIRGTTDEDQGTGQTGMRGGSTFASYLTSSSRFFTLKLAGQAGDTTVRIKAVLDVENQDPKKWKILYWRIY